MDVLGADSDFASLSTADLLEARDQYHWHLLNKKNVVGTAVGRYLIRTTDAQPEASEKVFSARRVMTVKPARTFENSEVRDYSWPCILVLVDEWLDADQFGLGEGQTSPDQVVPKTLYLPDGRTVPVCVVLVERAAPDDSVLPPRTWPAGRIGGGFPLLCEVQGVENFASVGTLVTDGHTVFALTSRHVTGPAGTVVSSIADGTDTPIGHSAANQLTRLPFSDVYMDFPGRRTYLTLDAGLIEVDDVTAWTSQGYGLPVVGELADLNEQNISVRLIGAEVRAFGAASGNLSGRITALFYRYRSVGGYDDVTDFLISPTPGTPDSRPGDSGTLWHLVQADGQPLRPIALQWGGQSFLASTGRNYNFTLATSLTNILRLLNVELVVDYNTGAQPFWGKTGHYTIASYATEHLTSPTLQTLMSNNVDRISFALRDLDATDINSGTIAGKKAGGFIPLADVPDLVWKNLPSAVKGGRDTAFRTGPEHPTHFADAVQPRPSDQKTIRELCMEDPANGNVVVWQEYYTSLGHTDPSDRGLLPFRVWQFFDEMVAALKPKTSRATLRPRALSRTMSVTPANPCTARTSLTGSPTAQGLGFTPPTNRPWSTDTTPTSSPPSPRPSRTPTRTRQ
ncbi:S1/P1 Nuclease [Subtercola sp. YIM 133946]|uniref:S1/P1 Nuclease n=1 Tax=Subtercola sp. YIM 133946 TaxID=3118909 RepID=UPI003FCED441